jgi:hypothetical protein
MIAEARRGRRVPQRSRIVARSLTLSLCCAWLAASTALAQPRALPLDGIAAVIGASAPEPAADIVLRSDVELRARMLLAGESRGDALPLGALPDALVHASLQEIIGEVLIAREAKRVQVTSPSAAETQRERDRMVRAAGGEARVEALLAALGASDDEIDVVARRRAVVSAFLNANLEGVTTVTQAELEQALAARAGAEGELEAGSLEQLRADLSRAALTRAVQRWVVMLRARTPLRVYAAR